MNTEKPQLQAAVPWNSSCYIPCNGFHPLYQALFDGDVASPLEINMLDEPHFAELLCDADYFQMVEGDVTKLCRKIKEKWAGHRLAEEFVEHVTAADLWINSRLPGDIELHHTSPLTAVERPFVFHCESFLPIFMPFAFQGRGFMERAGEVRDFYLAIFEDANCLGIYSHLQITLDQISLFFKSPQIDAKLKLTKIGLARKTYAELAGLRRDPKIANEPCFLFTSSAHQQPISFKVRGGYSALMFMERYLRSGRRGLFIFRSGRPSDDELESFGVNLSWLHEAERNQQIVWIEGFLPEQEQLSLFKLADFFLMPSVNLHSVSLMQAQLAGAIPVVTDTYGPDIFVEDGRTGIVLEGVRKIVWQADPATGIPCDDHRLWTRELAILLAEQMYDRVVYLLEHSEIFTEVREKMREYARVQYSGEQFRKEFFESVSKAYLEKTAFQREQQNTKLKIPLLHILDHKVRQLFQSPTAPYLILRGERANIYYLKGGFWLVSEVVEASTYKAWSPYALASEQLLAAGKVRLSWTLPSLIEEMLMVAFDQENPGHVLLNGIFGVEKSIKGFVDKFPRLRSWLKKFHPLLKRILFRIETIAVQRKTQPGRKPGILRRIVRFFSRIPVVQPLADKLKKLVRKKLPLLKPVKNVFRITYLLFAITLSIIEEMIKFVVRIIGKHIFPHRNAR